MMSTQNGPFGRIKKIQPQFIRAEVDLGSIEYFQIGRIFQRSITKLALKDKSILGYSTVYLIGEYPKHLFQDVYLVVSDGKLSGLLGLNQGTRVCMLPSSQFEGQIDRRFIEIFPSVFPVASVYVLIARPEAFQNGLLVALGSVFAYTLLCTVIYGILRWNFFHEKHGTREQLVEQAKAISRAFAVTAGKRAR